SSGELVDKIPREWHRPRLMVLRRHPLEPSAVPHHVSLHTHAPPEEIDVAHAPRHLVPPQPAVSEQQHTPRPAKPHRRVGTVARVVGRLRQFLDLVRTLRRLIPHPIPTLVMFVVASRDVAKRGVLVPGRSSADEARHDGPALAKTQPRNSSETHKQHSTHGSCNSASPPTHEDERTSEPSTTTTTKTTHSADGVEPPAQTSADRRPATPCGCRGRRSSLARLDYGRSTSRNATPRRLSRRVTIRPVESSSARAYPLTGMSSRIASAAWAAASRSPASAYARDRHDPYQARSRRKCAGSVSMPAVMRSTASRCSPRCKATMPRCRVNQPSS